MRIDKVVWVGHICHRLQGLITIHLSQTSDSMSGENCLWATTENGGRSMKNDNVTEHKRSNSAALNIRIDKSSG